MSAMITVAAVVDGTPCRDGPSPDSLCHRRLDHGDPYPFVPARIVACRAPVGTWLNSSSWVISGIRKHQTLLK